MTNYEANVNYRHSGNLISSNAKSPATYPGMLTSLKAIGSALLAYLTSGSELRIWNRSDRSGITWWHVYDPATRTSLRFLSEADVRTWLEEQHYGTRG